MKRLLFVFLLCFTAYGQRVPRVVDSVASLIALTPSATAPDVVLVATNNNTRIQFRYYPASADATNAVSPYVYATSTGTGRWKEVRLTGDMTGVTVDGSSIDATTKLNITNGTAVNLTGSLTNVTLNGATLYGGDGSNDITANTLFNLGLRGTSGGTVSVYPTAHTTKNIASMQALNTGLLGTNGTVEVRGYYEAGDGGGGTFYYAPIEATNRGTVFASGSGSFVWKRLSDGQPLNVRQFGAKGDGTTDDSAAFSALVDYAVQWFGTTGGGAIYIPQGVYKMNLDLSTPLANEESVHIYGDGPGATTLIQADTNAPVVALAGRNIILEELGFKATYQTNSGVALQIGNTNLNNGVLVSSVIRNVLILDFTTGIDLQGADQVLFDSVRAARCTNAVLATPRKYVVSPNANVLSKVKFLRSAFDSNYGPAFVVEGGYVTQLEFDTCNFEQNEMEAITIQQTQVANGNPIKGIEFNNCFFEYNNWHRGAGAFYDITYKVATVTNGLNGIYVSSLNNCWYNPPDSTHRLVRIEQAGNYVVRNSSSISSGAVVSIGNVAAVLDTDLTIFTKVELDSPGTAPSLNALYSTSLIAGPHNGATNSVTVNSSGVTMGDSTLLTFNYGGSSSATMNSSAAGVLALNGTQRINGGSGTTQAQFTVATGDSQGRFSYNINGKLEWGSGSGSRDITLERQSGPYLDLRGGHLEVQRTAANLYGFRSVVTGDSVYRMSWRADGQLEWSDGSAAVDTALVRSETGTLLLQKPDGTGTSGAFRVKNAAASDNAFLGGVSGDSSSRFAARADGQLEFGSGSAARDATIARTSAGLLTVTTNLAVAGTIELGHASDTTLARSAAGVVSVEGVNLSTVNDTTIWVDAGAMAPFATGGATAVTTTLTTNGIPVDEYSFDASTDKKVAFKMAMPSGWNGSTLTATFYWRTTATSGNCIWTIAGIFARDGDNPDVTLGSAQSVTDGAQGTANFQAISSATSTIVPAGTFGSGATVYFVVTRDADNGSDTLASAALLDGVAITWK